MSINLNLLLLGDLSDQSYFCFKLTYLFTIESGAEQFKLPLL